MYVVAGDAAVPVPVISPVDVLRVNPVGSGGAIANVIAPDPPDATTGVYPVSAIPTVSVLVGTA